MTVVLLILGFVCSLAALVCVWWWLAVLLRQSNARTAATSFVALAAIGFPLFAWGLARHATEPGADAGAEGADWPWMVVWPTAFAMVMLAVFVKRRVRPIRRGLTG